MCLELNGMRSVCCILSRYNLGDISDLHLDISDRERRQAGSVNQINSTLLLVVQAKIADGKSFQGA